MPNFEQPPQTAEQKMELLDQQISKLEQKRAEVLAEIDHLMKDAKTRTKKEREFQPGISFLEFNEDADVRRVKFSKDKKIRTFEFQGFGGQTVEVAESEMLTDMRWGIFYDLNENIVSKDFFAKYNEFRKKYVGAYFQHLINKLEAEKMLIYRLEVKPAAQEDQNLGKAYLAYKEGEQQGDKEKRAGFIFEKVVSGILEKVGLDLGKQFGFSFEEASVIEDIELKADCILKITGLENAPDKNRAVGVEENEQIKGIQLTLFKEGDPVFEDKKKQILSILEQIRKGKKQTKINDLAILNIGRLDTKDVMAYFRDWKNHSKAPGGPEKFFRTTDIMDDILKKAFKDTRLDLDKNNEFYTAIAKYLKDHGYKA